MPRQRHQIVNGMHVYDPASTIRRSCCEVVTVGLMALDSDYGPSFGEQESTGYHHRLLAHPDGYAGLRLARQIGRPCAAVIGGSDVLLLCRNSARRRCVLNVLNAVDRVIVVSQDLKDKVGQLGVDPEKGVCRLAGRR